MQIIITLMILGAISVPFIYYYEEVYMSKIKSRSTSEVKKTRIKVSFKDISIKHFPSKL